MEKQIINTEVRKQLILQLAKDNANEDCWKILELLPNENPSLDEMINACNNTFINGLHVLVSRLHSNNCESDTLVLQMWTTRPPKSQLSLEVNTPRDNLWTKEYNL